MAEEVGEGAGLQLTAGRHAKFLQRTLHVLPSSHANFDTQRVTISYFAIAGLDLLDQLELVAGQRREVVEWLHHCLVSPAPGRRGRRRCSASPGSVALPPSACSPPPSPPTPTTTATWR